MTSHNLRGKQRFSIFPGLYKKNLRLTLIISLSCIAQNSYAKNIIIDNSGTITTSSSKVEEDNSVAIGDNVSIKKGGPEAAQDHAWLNVAIGHNANITGSESVALGYGATVVKGWGNTAVGRSALAQYTGTTALGNFAQATAKYATALGTSSNATGFYSIAAGIKSQAAGWGSLATGVWSYAGEDHSVALGDYSVTEEAVSTASTEINGTTYNYAGGKHFQRLV